MLVHRTCLNRYNSSLRSLVRLSSFSTARAIAEDNHEKVLRYVLRKELKSVNAKIMFSDKKTQRLQELRDLLTTERNFQITDTPGSATIQMHRFTEDETIMVEFNPKDLIFDVRISKTKEGLDSIPYYFVFKYSTYETTQISAQYYSYDVDSDGERRSFAARYNAIEEFILEDAQSYMTDRGIDNVLSEFIELESAEKMRRENALSLKSLIGFLRLKE